MPYTMSITQEIADIFSEMQSEIDCFNPGTEVLVQELPEHCRVEIGRAHV